MYDGMMPRLELKVLELAVECWDRVGFTGLFLVFKTIHHRIDQHKTRGRAFQNGLEMGEIEGADRQRSSTERHFKKKNL